ncbi:MAG: hypothetical protein GKR97_10755 [Rhizobiaceae bacterium]|nr:hypothetical protein [Rhizobiaceae bacterium]
MGILRNLPTGSTARWLQIEAKCIAPGDRLPRQQYVRLAKIDALFRYGEAQRVNILLLAVLNPEGRGRRVEAVIW